MPRGDGTGPMTGTFRGGRHGNRNNAGPGGQCVCPNCGETSPHRAGTPCRSTKCPKCGTTMMRG